MSIDPENLEKSGNLKQTSESQKICGESYRICHEIPESGRSKEIICVKFMSS